MADNSLQNGTDKIATDELTLINGLAAEVGLKVQRTKMGFGPDGSLTDVASTNPLPVALIGSTGLTDTQLRAIPVPVNGALSVIANGLISSVNSSATALGISGIFAGAWEDVTEFADIRVTVFADQLSAVDGLQIQQSSNGTNADLLDAYNIPINTGKIFSVASAAKFYRVVYTNGATAQTAFRLQTKLFKTYTRGSSIRPQDARARDNDMDEILAYAMHYDGTNWNMQRGTLANGLAVDVTRIIATVSVAGTRNNNGSAAVAGSFHLTVGGSDGTNLRPMSVDTTGRLNVNAVGTFFQATQPISAVGLPLPAGASTEATLGALNTKVVAVNTGAVVMAAGTAVYGALVANQTVNTALVGGVAPLMGNGVTGTGSQRVTIASDNTPFAVNIAAAQTLANVTTVGTITNPIKLTDGVTSVSVKAASVAAVATDGSLVVALSPNSPVTLATPLTSATSSAATTNATSIKATAGTVFQILASNVGAAAAFLKIFNLATAPTVGTSVPLLTIPIPATGVVTIPFGTLGLRFSTGIAFSITNLIADADATVIAAAQVKVAISYQ